MSTPAEVGLVREAWTRSKKFILPEETVSLKTIFDNVRNYIMCAGVVGALGARASAEWPWTLTAFAIALIVANVLQSWFILEKWTARIGRFQPEVRPKWGRFQRRALRVILVLVLLPVFTSMFNGFALLVSWALRGGK